jgi:fructose-1,6-bisphosphatase/inositol monophosphatase family enzyme
VAHGDALCFEQAGRRAMFERMARELPMLRGYTDAFGHARVLAGGVDAMVDFSLNPWDVAATQILVAEAGGRCVTLDQAKGKSGLVMGSPALVEILLGWLDG